MVKPSLSPFYKALETLTSSFKLDPSELERDGLIQRFEYTFELSWKFSKRVLTQHGVETDSPKSVFRELAAIGWIDSAEPWIGYLNARNKVSHIYNSEVANEVFAVIPSFIQSAQALIRVLEIKV